PGGTLSVTVTAPELAVPPMLVTTMVYASPKSPRWKLPECDLLIVRSVGAPGVADGVAVGDSVAVAVALKVAVGPGVAVALTVGTAVKVGVATAVAVRVRVAVAVSVGVGGGAVMVVGSFAVLLAVLLSPPPLTEQVLVADTALVA